MKENADLKRHKRLLKKNESLKTEETMIKIQGNLSRFIKAKRNGRGKGLKIEKQEELKES